MWCFEHIQPLPRHCVWVREFARPNNRAEWSAASWTRKEPDFSLPLKLGTFKWTLAFIHTVLYKVNCVLCCVENQIQEKLLKWRYCFVHDLWWASLLNATIWKIYFETEDLNSISIFVNCYVHKYFDELMLWDFLQTFQYA